MITMLTKLILQSTPKSHLRPRVNRVFFYNKGDEELRKAIKKSTVKKPTQKCLEPEPYKILTMDDMLVPCGDWKKHYSQRNKNYNIIFVFGLVSLIGSIYICQETLFFNAFPPPYPFPVEEENMVCKKNPE